MAQHVDRIVSAPDGRRLAVAEWGDPNGRPLIALHGTPGSRLAHWRDPAVYSRFGVRRITYDRAGYGGSSRHAGRRVADVVGDVAAIADALAIGRFAVTGGSGGGPHALACAALLADRVERCLAAVCPAPPEAEGLDWFAGMTRGNVDEFTLARAGEAAIRPKLEAERTAMLERVRAGRVDFLGDDYQVSDSDMAQISKDLAIFSEVFEDGLRDGVDGWVDDDIAFARPWGFDPATIKVPVSVWYGREDTLVPAAHGDWLVAHVPGAEPVVGSSGHMGTDEDVELQLAWLTGQDPGR